MGGVPPDHRVTTDEKTDSKKSRSGFLTPTGGSPQFSPSAAEDAEVAAELHSRLKAYTPTTMMAHIILALALPILFFGQAPVWALATWTSPIIAAALYRVHVGRRSTGPFTVTRQARYASLVMAFAWAAGPFLVGQYLDLTNHLLVLVIFAGLVAGASSTLDADPSVFRVFVVILLGASAAGILMNGLSQLHVVAAILAMVFGAFMVALNALSHRALVKQIRTKAQATRTEARAGAERAFLDALLQSSPIAIATLGTDNLVLSVNPAFEQLFGYTMEDIRGRALNDCIVPHDQRDAAIQLDEAVAQSRIVVKEVVRARKDGSEVHVRVSAAMAKREAAGVIFTLYDDVSEIKKVEGRLKEAEAKYRHLVETASDMIWQLDREGRWVYLNDTSKTLLGRPPEELIGRPLREVLHPDTVEADMALFQSLLAGNAITDHETKSLDLTGSTHHVSISARPTYDQSGEVIGASGTARDITDRVLSRIALEEAHQTAKRTAATKSAFLANMSHEIRTPMNGILGMTELLLETNLDAEQRKSAELVRESGEALLTIINDILDFSKIESGRMEVEETEFELGALVESTIRLLGVKAFEREIELTCEISPRVPHRVLGDPGRMRQILNNLVGNAIKFTENGEVSVTLTLVSVTPEGVNNVGISVRDTGIGIPEDQLDSVFEEFTQADVTTTRKYGGTGLGLAITRKLVSLLRGNLKVTSVVGEGSEFTLVLPFTVVESDRPALVATQAGLMGTRALIIDDNGTNRRVVRGMLQAAGIEVSEAPSGEIGLTMLREALVEKRPYRVAVLDGQMPHMDGFGVAERIRRDPTLVDTRLMMLTSGGQPGDGQRCRDLGITGYLSKPASRSDLLETLAAVMSGPVAAAGSPTLITRHLIQENRKSLRILLAEDNPVNQQVAATMLRKRGHQVEIVENGEEALEAVRRMTYDLVLMDMQMPVMDGLTATRKIREDSGNANLPIVAVTAHALQEERDRCLQAGMSGYLSKPFKPHELFAIAERWATAPTDTPFPTVESDPSAPVDLAGFRSTMREAGVEEAVEAMLDVFVRDAPGRMTGLAAAIEAGTVPEIEAMAHAFKSASGTIGARSLAAVLQTLESAGRHQQPERAKAMLDQLRTEYEVAMTYLKTATERSAHA